MSRLTAGKIGGAGEYELLVGASVEDIRLCEKISVHGTVTVHPYEDRDLDCYYKGNVLTIHQTIPINGVASLTLTVDILPTTGDVSSMIDQIESQPGIHYLKILASE